MRIPGSFARKVTGSAKAIEFNPPGNNNAHSRFNPNPAFIFLWPPTRRIFLLFFFFSTSTQYAVSNHSHHLSRAPESSWWVSAGCLATRTDFSVNDTLCFNSGARTKVMYVYRRLCVYPLWNVVVFMVMWFTVGGWAPSDKTRCVGLCFNV